MTTEHTYDPAASLAWNLEEALKLDGTQETVFKTIVDTFQERDEIAKRLNTLTKELEDALQLRSAYNANVTDWRELCSYFNLPVSELSAVLNAIETMRKERDELKTRVTEKTEFDEGMRKCVKSIARLCGKTFPVDVGYQDLRDVVAALLANTQHLTPEQRYIVHGHVQPCVVLYSDETTTILRLQQGDMMCETDTIQWSDELTYRCQELLASANIERGSMAAQRVLPVLAELVRDERVLLNDDA